MSLFFRMVALLALPALLSGGAAPVFQAQEATPPGAPVGPPPSQISLSDAIRMGMENNLDVKVASVTPRIREQNILLREAAFDPNVRIFAEKRDDTFPTALRTVSGGTAAASISGSEEVIFPFARKQENYTISFQDPLRWGGSYQAQLDMTREITSSADAFLPLQYQTALFLAYNQSLLRNLGKSVNETQIVLAQNNNEMSRSEYRSQVFVSLQDIEDAYWELVFARQDLQVKEESLRLAQELLKLNRIKVEVGTLPPIEITTAEAEVASRDQGVIVAENTVRDAEDTLRRALNMPKGGDAWLRPIEPTDEPSFLERPVDLQQDLEVALANRPDLVQARLEVDNANTRLAFDKNQLKWDLGFRGTYLLSGLAGDNPSFFDPNTGTFFVVPLNEDFIDSYDSLAGGDFDSWSVSLNLNIPIGNNAAQANYTASRLALEQAEVSYERARLGAEVEVRIAARAILTNRKRIEAAEKNVELQRKKVEAEQKKFENGMSTSFQVLEFQEDLTTALGQKNRALVDYRKSITALEQAKGTLDDYLNVTVQ